MTPSLARLVLPCAVVLALLLLVWVVLRLGKVRRTLARAHDERQSEGALRAQAEALLAARLARGEIDQDTHRQLVQRLWGIEPPASTAATHLVGR